MHHPADTLRIVLQSAQAHLQAAIPAKGQECPEQVAVSDASMIDSDNYKEIDSTPHQIRPMSSASRLVVHLNLTSTFSTRLHGKQMKTVS